MLLLVLYQLQIVRDPLVVVLDHWSVGIIDPGFDLRDTVLGGLFRDDLIVAANNRQMVVKLLMETVVVTSKFVHALLHEAAELDDFLLRWEELKVVLDSEKLLLLNFVVDKLFECSDPLLGIPVVISQVKNLLL